MRNARGWLALAWLMSSTKAGAQPPPPDVPAPVAPAPAPQPATAAPSGTALPPAYPSAPPGGYLAPPGGYVAPPGGYVAPAYAYPPPPTGGVYVVAPAPPQEADEPGAHLHDGFYLRVALGGGWLGMRTDSAPEADVKGGGGSLDLLLGGTPIDGLVIGGGIFSLSASDPRVESGGKSSDLSGQASAVVVGPFVDGYFDAAGGLHVGGVIGLSSLAVKPDDDGTGFDEKPYEGAGLALFAGYDAWVSPNWSLGGYLRLVAARGNRDLEIDNETVRQSARAYGFSILFSALYH